MPTPLRPSRVGAPPAPTATSGNAPSAVAPELPATPDEFAPGRLQPGALPVAPVDLAAVLAHHRGPDPYALVPGRYPDAVGLPQVLERMASSPEGRAAVDQLLGAFAAKTGVSVPPAVRDAVLADPTLITRVLAVTPELLSKGMDGLNAAYRAGKISQVADRATVLPKRFELEGLEALALARPKPELKELAPALYTGDLPSSASDAEVKSSRVMAEVLDRLATNVGKPEAARFTVGYSGRSFTRLDNLLQALAADGHQVSVTFEQRVANFANLKTPVPGSQPPAWLDVPAPLMVKTGVLDGAGNEAVVPAAHAETIIRIRKGPETRGPGVDADVRFFQGVSGTGFFPAHTSAEPAWLGRVRHGEELEGAGALDAVRLAGLFSDLVQDSAKALNLYGGGYGVTGVCNDSVAVIQHAVSGETTLYPLLMRDEALEGELTKRLTDRDRRDDPAYRRLSETIRALPSDVRPTPTTAARAAASLTWEPGREPFESSAAARRVLAG